MRQRVLTQAVDDGGSGQEPGGVVYLAAIDIMTEEAPGIDSAFTRAQALKTGLPGRTSISGGATCGSRRSTPGSRHGRPNNLDSRNRLVPTCQAMLPAEGRRASSTSPRCFYNTGKGPRFGDSVFRKAANAAAADPKFVQDRKDALY